MYFSKFQGNKITGRKGFNCMSYNGHVLHFTAINLISIKW